MLNIERMINNRIRRHCRRERRLLCMIERWAFPKELASHECNAAVQTEWTLAVSRSNTKTNTKTSTRGSACLSLPACVRPVCCCVIKILTLEISDLDQPTRPLHFLFSRINRNRQGLTSEGSLIFIVQGFQE